MSDVKNFVSVTDRSTKAILSASGSLGKVVAELQTLAGSADTISQEIQFRQGELDIINGQYDQKLAEAQADLRIKVLNNEDKVLETLLKARGLVTVVPAELSQLRTDLAVAQDATEDAVNSAVNAARTEGDRALRSALANQEANHKVAIATLEANSSAKDQKITFLTEQVEELRKTVTAERETRLEIAKADSQRQGVVVNNGK